MDYINVGLKKIEIKTKTKTKQNKTKQNNTTTTTYKQIPLSHFLAYT